MGEEATRQDDCVGECNKGKKKEVKSSYKETSTPHLGLSKFGPINLMG